MTTSSSPSSEGVAEAPAADPTQPDVRAAADRVRARRGTAGDDAPRRGPGRPKGSKTKKRGSGGGHARAPVADAPDHDDIEVTPEDEQAVGAMLAVVWGVVAPMWKRRALTDDEQLRLGKAAAPVLAKYAPEMSQWTPEIGLVICVVGLWMNTKEPEPIEYVAEVRAGADAEPARPYAKDELAIEFADATPTRARTPGAGPGYDDGRIRR